MRCSTIFKAAVLLCLVSAAEAAETSVALVFEREGVEVRRETAAEISKAVPPVEIAIQDPHHGKAKRYRCWPIKALMAHAYGPDWRKSGLTEATLTAADGYASQSASDKLAEDGGCLAFADLDAAPGSWEPIGRKRADPGPYYLVWSKPQQTAQNAYPWPWQLATINLIRFEDRYPEVLPRGAKPGSAEHRGYETFKALCMRCHSINQQGGKIGPDLNAPQSVTSYRTKEWIESYVRQPSKYRYTEMPDHTQLSDEELEQLYAYLKLKATQPEKDWK